MSAPAPGMCRDRVRGSLLGLAAGDAVGTTLEFTPRDRVVPIIDMVGGGPFRLPPGAWTDDTSMALCLGHSLVACGGMDPGDQMQRYQRWFAHGEHSSTGICFDIGGTVSDALARHRRDGDPIAGSTDPGSAGNGSLMRLAPVVLFHAHDPDEAVRQAGESSRTTHGAAECVAACRLMAVLLLRALDGEPREHVLAPLEPDREAAVLGPLPPGSRLPAVARMETLSLPRDRVRGTGYVVDCLEAAIWSVGQADDFRGAILTAANLGDDADTTAAVAGQLAGALHGESGIPAAWRERLVQGQAIGTLADALAAAVEPSPTVRGGSKRE